MRSNHSQKLACMTTCFGLLCASGCYNMNGYVMNASGQGYYEQGNYAMASQEFQNALANNPHNPDYMANLAKSRMKMGDGRTAEQLFRQALTASPSHQPSYHGLAELMLAQGRGEEAAQLLNSWAATQPYVAESHVELAWLQRELGQHDASAQSLQKALQVNPSHSTALAHLGQYYQDTGQPTQAIAMYQQSLQSNWNQPEVHSRIAAAAEASGPNHPMTEMAMARGVNPQSLSRQQLAFGSRPGMPPAGYPPGPAMQQPAFQQPLAASGYAPAQHATAMPPQPVGMHPAARQPTGTPQQPTVPPIMMAGMTGQPAVHQMNSTMVPPVDNTAGVPPTGFNPFMAPAMGSGSVDVSNSTMTRTQPMTAESPLPVPDPEFLSNGSLTIPVTSASHSTSDEQSIPEVSSF